MKHETFPSYYSGFSMILICELENKQIGLQNQKIGLQNQKLQQKEKKSSDS